MMKNSTSITTTIIEFVVSLGRVFRKRGLVGIVIITIVIGLSYIVTTNKGKNAEKALSLSPKDIKTMTATLYDLKGTLGMPAVPEFRLEGKYIPIVLSAITPPRIDNDPSDWDKVCLPLGEITITTNTHQIIKIVIYDVGKSCTGFTLNGVRSFRAGRYTPVFVCNEYASYTDESILLSQIISEINTEQVTHQKSRYLVGYVNTFRRSRGDIPPTTRRRKES